MFGIGEAAFDGLFAPFVEGFPLFGFTVGVDFLPIIFPNVPSDGFYIFGVAGALTQQGAMLADLWVGAVFAIAFPVGGAAGQELTVWATIAILLGIINIVALVESSLDMGGTTVADDAVEVSIFQSLADRCCM